MELLRQTSHLMGTRRVARTASGERVKRVDPQAPGKSTTIIVQESLWSQKQNYSIDAACPRNLVPSAVEQAGALRHAANETMPRADTCEMTRFNSSKRSKNAVSIASPLTETMCPQSCPVTCRRAMCTQPHCHPGPARVRSGYM